MSQRKEQIILFLKKEPNDPFLQYALAMEFLAEGNDKKAKEQLLKLTEQFVEYLPSYLQLGMLFVKEGKKTKAVEILKKGEKLAQMQGNKHTLAEIKSELQNIQLEDIF